MCLSDGPPRARAPAAGNDRSDADREALKRIEEALRQSGRGAPEEALARIAKILAEAGVRPAAPDGIDPDAFARAWWD
ncbi:MAG: hypothetical protein ACXWKY_20465 [Caulobacteraceae bacterium]